MYFIASFRLKFGNCCLVFFSAIIHGLVDGGIVRRPDDVLIIVLRLRSVNVRVLVFELLSDVAMALVYYLLPIKTKVDCNLKEALQY